MTSRQFISTYDSNYDQLVQFGQNLTLNKNDALDIVQEASIRAYKYKEKLSPEDNFLGWMRTIIKNVFITRYKKNKRRQQLMQGATKEMCTLLKSETYNRGVQQMGFNSLKSRIGQVKEKYRKPFFLYFKGYSYHEIAEQMEIPEGTVKSRIYTAKQKMQALIAI